LLPFIWKGRVTSCVAQNAKRSYRALFNKQQIKASLKTMMLEFIKGWLARFGNIKYAMHKDNKVLRKSTLIDGTNINEFMRCNPAWGGVSCFDQARGIHHVLTKKVLDTLVDKEGCSILYSHLGKVHSVIEPFTDETRQAFELLADYQNDHKILTTTTRRLLGYIRTYDELSFTVKRIGDQTHIYLSTEYSGEDLNGLTWYVEQPRLTSLYINNVKYTNLMIHHKSNTEQASVSIKWEALTFPNMDVRDE